MDAFAFMKKKMQEKHLVFGKWDERGGGGRKRWLVLMSSKLAFSSLKYHYDIKDKIFNPEVDINIRTLGEGSEFGSDFFIHYVMKVEETA